MKDLYEPVTVKAEFIRDLQIRAESLGGVFPGRRRTDEEAKSGDLPAVKIRNVTGN